MKLIPYVAPKYLTSRASRVPLRGFVWTARGTGDIFVHHFISFCREPADLTVPCAAPFTLFLHWLAAIYCVCCRLHTVRHARATRAVPAPRLSHRGIMFWRSPGLVQASPVEVRFVETD